MAPTEPVATETVAGVIKRAFAIIAAVLFVVAGFAVLWGAQGTPEFEPNEAQVFLLDTVGGAIIVFIAAELGITIAIEGKGANLSEGAPHRSFGSRAKEAMGSGKFAEWLLLLDAVVFVVIGLCFVLLWISPSLLAVKEGDPGLIEAPEYIASQAKAFVGVTLAALAGLAPASA